MSSVFVHRFKNLNISTANHKLNQLQQPSAVTIAPLSLSLLLLQNKTCSFPLPKHKSINKWSHALWEHKIKLSKLLPGASCIDVTLIHFPIILFSRVKWECKRKELANRTPAEKTDNLHWGLKFSHRYHLVTKTSS